MPRKTLPAKVRTDKIGRKYALDRKGKRIAVKEAHRRNRLSKGVRKRIRDDSGKFGTRIAKIRARIREAGGVRASDPGEDYFGTEDYTMEVSTEDRDEWRTALDRDEKAYIHFDVMEVK